MASVIKVKVAYEDGSRSLSQEFACADSKPSGATLEDCQDQVLKQWTDSNGSLRGTKIDTTVRISK